MKTLFYLFGLSALISACDFSSSEHEALRSDLNSSGAEMWEQVGVRFPATGEIVLVSSDSVVTLQIAGDDLLFGLSGNYCDGKINDGAILLDTCYSQSPHWIITERTQDTMYIYPRMGAMYYYDLVMKKVEDNWKTNCGLQPNSGPCEALIQKYYFDQRDGECKPFNWGGCQGVIPFDTMEECVACQCNQPEAN